MAFNVVDPRIQLVRSPGRRAWLPRFTLAPTERPHERGRI